MSDPMFAISQDSIAPKKRKSKKSPTVGPLFPPPPSLYVDFSGAAHHVALAQDGQRFVSMRVGDGERVVGLPCD